MRTKAVRRAECLFPRRPQVPPLFRFRYQTATLPLCHWKRDPGDWSALVSAVILFGAVHAPTRGHSERVCLLPIVSGPGSKLCERPASRRRYLLAVPVEDRQTSDHLEAETYPTSACAPDWIFNLLDADRLCAPVLESE